MNYKLGKRIPRLDRRTLRFAKYVTPALPAPPASVDWQDKVPPTSWGMDGNDVVGDCTIAAAAHMIEAWTFNAEPTTPVVLSTQDVEQDYFALTGGLDIGLDLLTVLNQWRKAGLAYNAGKADLIQAYAALQPGDKTQAQQAIALFCGGYIGLELPNFVVDSPDPLTIPWVVPPGGPVGPLAAPNPANGHAVPLVGYDADNVYIVTWGAVIPMSWGFYTAYSDEGYAVLSPDWIETSGESPAGFDMTQLEQDLTEITTGPSPSPPPPPSPPPGPPASCIRLIEQGVNDFVSGQGDQGIDEVEEGILCLIGALNLSHGKTALRILEAGGAEAVRSIERALEEIRSRV